MENSQYSCEGNRNNTSNSHIHHDAQQGKNDHDNAENDTGLHGFGYDGNFALQVLDVPEFITAALAHPVISMNALKVHAAETHILTGSIIHSKAAFYISFHNGG